MCSLYRLLRVFTVLALLVTVLAIVSPVQSQADPNLVLLLPPPNDNFIDAETLVFNKRAVTSGALAAASLEPLETSDPDLTSCAMHGTVWYKFTPAFSGSVALSTAGSYIEFANYHSIDTRIAVYTGSSLSTLAQVDCNNDYSGFYAEIPYLTVSPGVTYYVRVGALYSYQILGGRFKLKVVITNAIDYDPLAFPNLGFDTDLAGNWVVKNAFNGDMRVCSVDCEFKFVGGPDEATTIQQTRSWPSSVMLAREDHLIEVWWTLRTSPNPNFKAQICVSYTDGTPKSKGMRVFTTELISDTTMGVGVAFDSPNVKKVKITFTNKATSGTAYFDVIRLDYEGGLLRQTTLPLPLAPQ